jgi:exopolysaccharide biosynthesis WecB/TagA/CpsF family protein
MATNPLNRVPLLGVDITVTERPEAAVAVLEAAREGIGFGVSALAVHGVMESVFDPELQYRLNDLEMVVADGQPVRWAMNWIHSANLSDRVCGPDLMDDICRAAAMEGLPVYFYGSTRETLADLNSRLLSKYPGLKVAGAQPSRFRPATAIEQESDIDRILASGARILFVGLGCPRQEVWTFEVRHRLSMPVLAVGAAFDFHAGRSRRAPTWMQQRGLEWLFRLIQEPRRLWRRYLLLNPSYVGLVLLQRLGLRTIRRNRARDPQQPLRPS